jgi:uncharacterized repeat protein (TIGR03803 family)
VNVVYSFFSTNGEYPEASLIDVKGTLYGTTRGGGYGCSGYFGCGTAFSVTPGGTEQVLHEFGKNGPDGVYP